MSGKLNKRKSPTGFYWVNIDLNAGKKGQFGEILQPEYLLCTVELINEEIMMFRLWSTASKKLEDRLDWVKSLQKLGWYYKDFLQEEINEFLN